MHQIRRASWNFATTHPPVAGLIRFIVMAIGLLIPANVIGRLFYAALGQVPGTTAWNYSLLFYILLNISAVAAIGAPNVSQPGKLTTIFLASLRMMTTYCTAFANLTIGLMALSIGYLWGGGWIVIGLIYLVGACNLLRRLVRQ
jgi:hypothetical protein